MSKNTVITVATIETAAPILIDRGS
jgi:hypothetical protein